MGGRDGGIVTRLAGCCSGDRGVPSSGSTAPPRPSSSHIENVMPSPARSFFRSLARSIKSWSCPRIRLKSTRDRVRQVTGPPSAEMVALRGSAVKIARSPKHWPWERVATRPMSTSETATLRDRYGCVYN